MKPEERQTLTRLEQRHQRLKDERDEMGERLLLALRGYIYYSTLLRENGRLRNELRAKAGALHEQPAPASHRAAKRQRTESDHD